MRRDLEKLIFLKLSPPVDGWEVYFRTVAAYRFPGISDIHSDSGVLKNKLGVILCSENIDGMEGVIATGCIVVGFLFGKAS